MRLCAYAAMKRSGFQATNLTPFFISQFISIGYIFCPEFGADWILKLAVRLFQFDGYAALDPDPRILFLELDCASRVDA